MTTSVAYAEPRETFPVLWGGAGLAARTQLPTLEPVLRNSRRQTSLVLADPAPGKAADFVRTAARSRAINNIRAEEDTLQNMQRRHPDAFVIDATGELGKDGLADTFDIASQNRQPVVATCFIFSPDENMRAIRAHATADDNETKTDMSNLCKTLSDIVSPTNTSDMFGERARPENRMLASDIRRGFALDTRTAIERFFAGMPPDRHPIEVTRDGRTFQPIIVLDDDNLNERDIMQRAFEKLRTPVQPGQDLVVAQLLPDAVIFHLLRIQMLDRQPSYRGSELFAAKETFDGLNPLRFCE